METERKTESVTNETVLSSVETKRDTVATTGSNQGVSSASLSVMSVPSVPSVPKTSKQEKVNGIISIGNDSGDEHKVHRRDNKIQAPLPRSDDPKACNHPLTGCHRSKRENKTVPFCRIRHGKQLRFSGSGSTNSGMVFNRLGLTFMIHRYCCDPERELPHTHDVVVTHNHDFLDGWLLQNVTDGKTNPVHDLVFKLRFPRLVLYYYGISNNPCISIMFSFFR